jgi:hypothetical protein
MVGVGRGARASGRDKGRYPHLHLDSNFPNLELNQYMKFSYQIWECEFKWRLGYLPLSFPKARAPPADPDHSVLNGILWAPRRKHLMFAIGGR